MTYIYLVTGHTGCYEDRYEWSVKAFKGELEARAYVTKLKTLCDLLPRQDYEGVRYTMQEYNDILSLDPEFSEDFLTGTYYDISKVEYVE